MNTQELCTLAKNLRSTEKREKIVKSWYPELYTYLIDNYPDISFVEKIYWFVNDVTVHPVCKNCGKLTKFVDSKHGYKTFCCTKCSNSYSGSIEKSKCTKLSRYGNCNNRNKAIQTKLERYGDENFNNREKRKVTNIERYGVDNPMKNKTVSSKMHSTKLERYGDKNYTNPEKRRQTKLERYGDENFTNPEKRRQTKLERYGDENFTNPEKRRQTCLKRYGFEELLRDPEVQKRYRQIKFERYGDEFYNNWEQGKQTCLEIHGAQAVFGTKEYQERSKLVKMERYGNEYYSNWEQGKQTCLERYGVENPFQCEEFKEKSKQTRLERYGDPNYHNIEKIIETRQQHQVQSTDHDRVKDGTVLCTRLLPFDAEREKNTTLEQFVKNILDKHGIKYDSNSRTVISPKEVDIYVPSRNLAFECNGVYWHSVQHSEINKTVHLYKRNLCQEKGIQLISIWEDWIKLKPTIVTSLVLSKLGIYDRRLYARKCKIKELDSKVCNKFLEENHIQGKTNSTIKLGLYLDDELVSVMTFSQHKSSENKNWELSRFCNKCNTQVVGGASKLLAYFIKKYNPEQIISFSSNDISNGNLYKQLGFEQAEQTSAYWYVHRNTMKRYHRMNFTKRRLKQMGFDVTDKTEDEIMNNLPFFKIYDSGHIKWIWNKQ